MTHSTKQKVAMQIQAGLVLLINPVIVSIVLKHLYGRVNFQGGSEARRIAYQILLLGILFEVAMVLRILLI